MSPCRAIERCFAESPFVQKKKKERSFFFPSSIQDASSVMSCVGIDVSPRFVL